MIFNGDGIQAVKGTAVTGNAVAGAMRAQVRILSVAFLHAGPCRAEKDCQHMPWCRINGRCMEADQ